MSTNPETALEARYGAAAPAAILWNATVETMLAHRSVRSFLPDPLPENALETLIAAAQSAPTSSNLSQWSVIAVADPATKRDLQALCRVNAAGIDQTWIGAAPLLLVWVADLSRTHRIGAEAGLRFEGMDYFDTFLTAAIDASLAAQNAITAARSIGLATVPIGAIRNDPGRVAQLLGLPSRSVAVFGLVVGHEDASRPSRVQPRPPQDVDLHRERYDADSASAGIESFDGTVRDFQVRHGQPARGWKSRVVSVNEGVGYLDGREWFRQSLLRRDFPLR